TPYIPSDRMLVESRPLPDRSARRAAHRLPPPEAEKDGRNGHAAKTRLEFSYFERDPRGDAAPQSLARGRRDGPRGVDAARPRRVAAHCPPVPARRACEPQRAGDRTGQRSLSAPGRRPTRRLAEPD